AKLGVRVDFLRWVKSRLGKGDTYYVAGFRERFGDPRVPPSSQRVAFQVAYDWMLFQLSPNVAVGRPEDADWVIIYDAPTASGYPRSHFGPLETFARGYALAGRHEG
ncbi:MAG: hypothetical protein M3Z54_14530, partial [Gemmatimonadota bacterium]|nr:hypothetical protein [Gemmatimonadota bacterium]